RAMAAYLVGAWLLLQVANVTFPPLGLPEWTQRALIIGLAIGIVPAFVLAWIFDITAQGIVRTARVDRERGAAGGGAGRRPAPVASRGLAEAVLAAPAGDDAASAQARNGAAGAHEASIAILPFADMSAAHDQDWFCDGLAEEIIDSMCCVR